MWVKYMDPTVLYNISGKSVSWDGKGFVLIKSETKSEKIKCENAEAAEALFNKIEEELKRKNLIVEG